MLLAALFAVFILLPIAEIYVILQVGDAIGAPLTVLLLVADSVFGAWLVRSQGRAVWARFTRALETGRPPHREVIDGALVILGGAFLVTPGFITDVVGAFFLLPPTRAIARRLIMRGVGRRLTLFVAGRPGGRVRPNGDWDVEGSAVEHDPPQIER